MNKAQWRYYVVNQLLVKGSIPHVPVDQKDVLDGLDLKQVVAELAGFGELQLTELEWTFLNYLRTPDYPVCVAAGSGNVLSIGMIADRVRSCAEGITVESTKSWASASILEVLYADIKSPEIQDSVLILPLSYQKGGVDLVAAMEKAFAFFCWGAENPTEERKALVQWCTEFTSPTKSVQAKAGFVKKFVDMCVKAKVNPVTLTRTVLYVSDLSCSIKTAGLPCWWSNYDHTLVSLMLPQGKGDWIACAKIPLETFTQLVGAGGAKALSTLYVKGTRIMQDKEPA